MRTWRTIPVIEQEAQASAFAYDPYATLNLRVAEAVKEQLQRKPESVFGLPTGRTPTGVYRLLSRWSKEGELDWSKARCFGLDEYYDADESETFRRYLETNLYRNVNLQPQSRFNPIFVDNYDAAIAEQGGLDLTILGIGKNGHIAFNEPGTPLHSWTHCVYLTDSTRQANAEFFKRTPEVPRNAITMGVQTILSSRKIILMASGKQKKGILERALRGPITEELPASFLQLHANVVVMTDFEW
jgi:glucosamine-6-phosphate deaminase